MMVKLRIARAPRMLQSAVEVLDGTKLLLTRLNEHGGVQTTYVMGPGVYTFDQLPGWGDATLDVQADEVAVPLEPTPEPLATPFVADNATPFVADNGFRLADPLAHAPEPQADAPEPQAAEQPAEGELETYDAPVTETVPEKPRRKRR